MSGSSKPIVLICEDESHIRASICYVVKKAGYNCEQASDGEVCVRLRSEPAFAEIKIIILTAYGQAVDELKTREVSANCFIVKPFSPRFFMDTLAELLS